MINIIDKFVGIGREIGPYLLLIEGIRLGIIIFKFILKLIQKRAEESEPYA